MSGVKYFISKFDNAIKEVPFVSETDKFVTIMRKKWSLWGTDAGTMESHRTSKHSSSDGYYDTWDEAHDALLKREQSKVDGFKARLQEARSSLGQVQSMKHPTKD